MSDKPIWLWPWLIDCLPPRKLCNSPPIACPESSRRRWKFNCHWPWVNIEYFILWSTTERCHFHGHGQRRSTQCQPLLWPRTLAPDCPAPECLYASIYIQTHQIHHLVGLLTQTLDPSTPCVSTEWSGTFPPGFLALLSPSLPLFFFFFFWYSFTTFVFSLFFLVEPTHFRGSRSAFRIEMIADTTTRCHERRILGNAEEPKWLRSDSRLPSPPKRTLDDEAAKGERRKASGPKPKRVLNLGKCRWLLSSSGSCLVCSCHRAYE